MGTLSHIRLLLKLYTVYSKELSLGNQPLETQRWIWPQFLGNWLAGPSVSKLHTGHWKLSAGFCPSFLETGWLAPRPSVSNTDYCAPQANSFDRYISVICTSSEVSGPVSAQHV